jgi:hypothetical protein
MHSRNLASPSTDPSSGMTGIFSHALMFKPRAGCVWLLVVAAVSAGGLLPPSAAVGQLPKSPKASAMPAAVPAEREFEEQVRELVDGLRDDEFARREEASEKLFQLGHAALPILRSNRRQIGDVEQTDRLDRIIDSLAKQDLDSRINAFLQGGPSELENWPELEKWFGDSPRVRELFVDLYREHPYLVESLGGTPQELSIGLSLVRRRLMERGVGPRETPQRIDLLALLLPMTKEGFNADQQYDLIVTQLLQLYPANEFRNDQVFGEPFMRIVTQWMAESDLNIREPVLRLTLLWKMEIGLPLALKTLSQTEESDIVARCMQVIARQGNREHLVRLAGYLDDPAVVFRKRYLGGSGGEVQVGDVAAAAIAFLSSVPVTEIGFAEPAEHEIFGIIFEELVVPLKEVAPKRLPDREIPGGNDKLDRAVPEPEERIGEDGFGVGPESWEQLRELHDQVRRREAARAEIHRKALQLVPKPPVAEGS